MKYNPFEYNKSDHMKATSPGFKWDSSDAKVLKRKLRWYLAETFERRCFYCQTIINEGNILPEIDHIVNKANKRFSNFSFQPKNLVWACRVCNTKKSTKQTLVVGKQALGKDDKPYDFDDYPFNSKDYQIVHPYLDKYEEHIVLEDGIFYKANNDSSKGKYTIEMCDLYRLSLAEDKIKEQLLKKENQYSMMENFKSLYESGTDSEINSMYQFYINQLKVEEEYFKFKELREKFNSPVLLDLAKYAAPYGDLIRYKELQDTVIKFGINKEIFDKLKKDLEYLLKKLSDTTSLSRIHKEKLKKILCDHQEMKDFLIECNQFLPSIENEKMSSNFKAKVEVVDSTLPKLKLLFALLELNRDVSRDENLKLAIDYTEDLVKVSKNENFSAVLDFLNKTHYNKAEEIVIHLNGKSYDNPQLMVLVNLSEWIEILKSIEINTNEIKAASSLLKKINNL